MHNNTALAPLGNIPSIPSKTPPRHRKCSWRQQLHFGTEGPTAGSWTEGSQTDGLVLIDKVLLTRSRSYLHPSLRQVGAHGQPLTHHHIRVVSLLEGLFQGLELLSSERCTAATLFAVLGAITGLQDDVLKCTAVGGQGEGAHLIMGNRLNLILL